MFTKDDLKRLHNLLQYLENLVSDDKYSVIAESRLFQQKIKKELTRPYASISDEESQDISA